MVNASFDATKHGNFILRVMEVPSWEVPRSPKRDNYYCLHSGGHKINWRYSVREPVREPEKVERWSLSLWSLTVPYLCSTILLNPRAVHTHLVTRKSEAMDYSDLMSDINGTPRKSWS